ncbi:hypothetical protein LA6_002262 [Marinibacterium anthonyi]|nr:hypothetical protein LA6_002262 [Marinibacterium anthonyi]
MPNIKIFVDQAEMAGLQGVLTALLPDLRAQLCAALGVDLSISQVAVLPVIGLPDQPVINVELHLLSAPARTPEALRKLAQDLRDMLGQATGRHAAIRIATFEPGGYVTLK